MGSHHRGRPAEVASFECLECGTIVYRRTHPGRCDTCGGFFHARSTPRE